jgi:hypothetical protein
MCIGVVSCLLTDVRTRGTSGVARGSHRVQKNCTPLYVNICKEQSEDSTPPDEATGLKPLYYYYYLLLIFYRLRVLGYRSKGPGSIPGATKIF